MKENVKHLPGKEKLVCKLTEAKCPRHWQGHRYMGVTKCSGCPSCTIEYPDGTRALYVRSNYERNRRTRVIREIRKARASERE